MGDAPHSYLCSSECRVKALDDSGGGLTMGSLTAEIKVNDALVHTLINATLTIDG